jgi:hypothetical protein
MAHTEKSHARITVVLWYYERRKSITRILEPKITHHNWSKLVIIAAAR